MNELNRTLYDYENTNQQITCLTGFDVFQLKDLFAKGYKLIPPDSSKELLDYIYLKGFRKGE